MSQKVKFGSKIGLIAATVGSAVGLGNIWRFPAETQANGGAVFLLIYIACVFLLCCNARELTNLTLADKQMLSSVSCWIEEI